MKKSIIVFVEGEIDQLFIEKIFDKILLEICEEYNVFKYSKKNTKCINNYLKSIKSIKDYDYIFLVDQDKKENKLDEILKQYDELEKTKTFVSIIEIESWILAGMSDVIRKKYKINKKINDTSIIDKEYFLQLIPQKISNYVFINDILEEYDIEKAMNLNKSFAYFYNYIIKKASK